jgi:hypothetical protein
LIIKGTYHKKGEFNMKRLKRQDIFLTLIFTMIFVLAFSVSGYAGEPPIADPNGPYSAFVGEAITFDGSGSSDPDGTIVAYDWDFGDGFTDTGVSSTYSYSAAATFTVSLTVTDNDGLTDTATTTATISAAPIALDLDIAQFRVTKRVRLTRVKPVTIKLVVKNNGAVNSQTRPANVIGMQGDFEVYNETMDVTDPVGNGRSSFIFPSYTPVAGGNIVWTATIADNDPDVDQATAITRVVP